MKDDNINILRLAVHELGPLANNVVFVGGATVGLYITDSAVPNVRATVDVDCVVEVTSQSGYHDIEEQLRARGFSHDTQGPICRFLKGPLILDVMPTSGSILGFTNQWYPEGVANSMSVALSPGQEIAVFTSPYFLASKLEAFKGRGEDDFRASHDLEDIIAVLDGNEGIANHIGAAPKTVQAYLKQEFQKLLGNSDFLEAMEGHIADRQNSGSRVRIVISRMAEVLRLP